VIENKKKYEKIKEIFTQNIYLNDGLGMEITAC